MEHTLRIQGYLARNPNPLIRLKSPYSTSQTRTQMQSWFESKTNGSLINLAYILSEYWEGGLADKTDLIVRPESLPRLYRGEGSMMISLETYYASVGEDHEDLGRTYLRLQEIGTFTSDTPYPVIRDKINETLRWEQEREQKMLNLMERGVEHRRQMLQR